MTVPSWACGRIIGKSAWNRGSLHGVPVVSGKREGWKAPVILAGRVRHTSPPSPGWRKSIRISPGKKRIIGKNHGSRWRCFLPTFYLTKGCIEIVWRILDLIGLFHSKEFKPAVARSTKTLKSYVETPNLRKSIRGWLKHLIYAGSNTRHVARSGLGMMISTIRLPVQSRSQSALLNKF